jgi:AAHS family 4-hydroxybenzoate transporter-like MFS transporter
VIAAVALLIKEVAHPETPVEHTVAVEEAHTHKQEARYGGHLD